MHQYNPENRYDAIVIGAGISGLVSASILATERKSVLLIDDYHQVGGNHISCDIGNMSFDIGSFFFHEKSAFFRHFPKLLGLYFPAEASVAKIRPDGELTRYPVDPKKDLLGLPFSKKLRVASSLLWSRLTVDPQLNALAFITYWIGREFGDTSGLIPYLRRFYSTEPWLIESSFAQKRMGWVARNASLRGLVRKIGHQHAARSNTSYVRPKAGFQKIYAAAGEILHEKGVAIHLGSRIRTISRAEDGSMVVTSSHGRAYAPQVFSTVPVTTALHYCGLPVPPELKSASLVSLFYSFRGVRGFRESVLYNFHDRGLWKRLTMHSDYYGEVEGKAYFSVETTVTGAPLPASHYDADFRKDVAAKGLFCGDLVLEGSNTLEHAYPIYLKGATAAADRAIEALERFGVTSYGRQGGFDYQPTGDISATVAEAKVREKL